MFLPDQFTVSKNGRIPWCERNVGSNFKNLSYTLKHGIIFSLKPILTKLKNDKEDIYNQLHLLNVLWSSMNNISL